MKNTAAVVLAAALLAGGSLAAMADDDRHERGEGFGHGCEHKGGHHGWGHHGRGHGGMGFDGERRTEHLTRLLKLDDQQAAKVRTVASTYDKQFDALRDKMSDNRKQLRELLARDNASEAEVRKLAEAQGKLKADTLVLRTRMHREIDQVLTPEQRVKHRELREQHGRRVS
jgi:protein CpxP